MPTISYSLAATPTALYPNYLVGVNNGGMAVGSQEDGSWLARAVLFDGSNVISIHPPGARSSVATDINDSGQVVGSGRWESGEGFAFLRHADGTMVYLDLPQAEAAYGLRLNDHGVIVATCADRPIRWQPLTSGGTAFEFLGDARIPGQPASSVDIDNNGRVVAIVGPDIFSSSVISTWSSGAWTPVPGAGSLQALTLRAASASGAIAGVARGSTYFHVGGGSLRTLHSQEGVIHEQMVGITANGRSVVANIVPSPGSLAFGVRFFDYGFVYVNSLPPPNLGWTLWRADGISDDGRHIVGTAELGGEYYWYRLTQHIAMDETEPHIPPIEHGVAIRILSGQAGGTGVGIPPHGEPKPVPPRPADGIDVTSGMKEVLSTLAAHELTRYSLDPETRRTVQPALLRAAIQRLERMAVRAAMGPGDQPRVSESDSRRKKR